MSNLNLNYSNILFTIHNRSKLWTRSSVVRHYKSWMDEILKRDCEYYVSKSVFHQFDIIGENERVWDSNRWSIHNDGEKS